MKRYYLDNAATTKVDDMVIDEMMMYMRVKWQNPSSLYNDAEVVKKDVDMARRVVADFIHAKPEEIYFTSCGSESNCWAIQGFVNKCRKGYYTPALIHSAIEHKSIMSCCDSMAHLGVRRSTLGVDKNGFVNIQELIKDLKRYTSESIEHRDSVLVSVQMANNECGTIQDILNISNVVHMFENCYLHVDAVQAFGQVPIDVDALRIDMLSASGHKLGTPKGIGMLYVRKGTPLSPIVYGSQMDGMRGGTENVPYIMGFAKAVEIARSEMEWHDVDKVVDVRNHFMNRLLQIGCVPVGASEHRLPNNVCVMLPKGCGAEEMVYMLDASGIQASTGSACNAHSKKASDVMLAMGYSIDEASRVIRFTLSTKRCAQPFGNDDVDYIVGELEKCIRIMRGQAE